MCAGSFLLDLGRRIAGHAKEYMAAAWAGGERSSSHASDEEEGASVVVPLHGPWGSPRSWSTAPLTP